MAAVRVDDALAVAVGVAEEAVAEGVAADDVAAEDVPDDLGAAAFDGVLVCALAEG